MLRSLWKFSCEEKMDRAFLVGINTYHDAPLAGCVNDAQDVAEYLLKKHQFKEADIRLLVDARATTSMILERLEWLVFGLKPGDRVVFHYAGHGAQVPTRSITGEVDGQDEVICPVDFDWSDARLIRDKQLVQIFSKIPPGVKFIWLSDSCHSGDLTRGMPPAKKFPRRFPIPADMLWRQRTAVHANITSLGFARASAGLNLAFISGCRSDQTSADANINNRPCGAFTHHLLKVLMTPNGHKLPLAKVVPLVVSELKKSRYTQVPQLEGSNALTSRPFLG